MNANATVRDQFIAWAQRKGFARLFGNPGSTELTMFRDWPDDLAYTMALHEGCTVAMADGYAQARREPALINLHSAAGVGNAMGTIFTAFRNGTPLIITAGQQTRSLLLHDPFLHSDRATELVRPYVKYALEPARAQDVPGAIAKAWQIALTPPFGPVFVSIPADDWDVPGEPWADRPAPLGAAAGDVTALAEALAKAQDVVFVVGGEVDRSGAWDAVIALAERTAAKVWQAPLEGRVGFPQTHPQFAGMLAADPVGVRQALAGHDLIVAIGARAFTYHIDGPKPFAPEAPLFILSENSETLAAAVSGQSILGDIRRTLETLLPLAGETRQPRRYYAASSAAGSEALDLPFFLQTLNRLRHPESAIVEEAPTARGPLVTHLPIDRPNQFFTCASGGLGFGLPASVGVALARPEHRTIALIGDGSSMYGIQSLHAAAREQANLLVIILNNRRYAALDGFASKFQLSDPPGCDLAGLDFTGLARAQGMVADRVDEPGQLEPILANALSARAPMLLEITLP